MDVNYRMMVGFQIDLELHEMITNLELGEATLPHTFLMRFELFFNHQIFWPMRLELKF